MIKKLGWASACAGVLGALLSMGCVRAGTAVISNQGTTYIVVQRMIRSDVYHCTATPGARPVCAMAQEQ